MLDRPRVGSATAPHRDITLAIALGWGLGSVGMSAVFQAFSVLLLRYLTDYIGIAAVVAGLLIGLSKLFDAVIDPLIGALSDRTRSRWGRRRPYLLLGGALCAVAFLLMFNLPVLGNQALQIILVEAVLMLFAAGYAFFNIPYLAMPPEMSSSPHERTYLISFRVGAVAIGSLLASFIGPLLITAGGGGVRGHGLMALAIAAITLAASVGCFLLTGKARFTLQGKKSEHSLAMQFRLALENKPFTSLIFVKLAQLLGAGVTFAITPYLFIQILKSTYAAMGVYFLVYFIAMILGQPIFVRLCRRYGKKAVYLSVAPAMIAVTLSWLWAAPNDPIVLTLGRGAALGFIGGSTLLIIQGMLPDTIHYDFIRTGLTREGVFAGVFITIDKLAAALAAGAVGIILGAFGYISSSGPKVVQPQSAIQAIYLVASMPALLMLLSCLLMLRYHLTEDMLLGPTARADPHSAILDDRSSL
jgi:GPH family glycoside/pentoside/hexuronide:cation symporter